MKLVKRCQITPRILGLAGTLLPAMEQPFVVETEIALAEKAFHSRVDFGSCGVTILQYAPIPREYLLQHNLISFRDEADVVKMVNGKTTQSLKTRHVLRWILTESSLCT